VVVVPVLGEKLPGPLSVQVIVPVAFTSVAVNTCVGADEPAVIAQVVGLMVIPGGAGLMLMVTDAVSDPAVAVRVAEVAAGTADAGGGVYEVVAPVVAESEPGPASVQPMAAVLFVSVAVKFTAAPPAVTVWGPGGAIAIDAGAGLMLMITDALTPPPEAVRVADVADVTEAAPGGV
jgi:hypothetical protein